MISFIGKFILVSIIVIFIAAFYRNYQLDRSDNEKVFIKSHAPKTSLEGFYKGSVHGYHGLWMGKKFNSKDSTGVNVFDSTKKEDYPFVTSIGKGLRNNNLDVLKIDYDIPSNPFWLRIIRDEAVETAPGVILGKMQLNLFPQFPFTILFFELRN